MPYIGTSPTSAVRRIYTYTATAGQTTFSGASNEGSTLAYVDQNYIDVYLNGILLNSADYTATSGSSIVLGSGASVSDILTVTVYDVFGVADTVSKKDGGTFDGNVTMGGTLDVSGAFTSQGIDDNADATAITIDSSENVGIGTTSPAAGLHLEGTANNLDSQLKITATGVVSQYIGGSSSEGLAIGHDSGSTPIVFKTGVTSGTGVTGSGTIRFALDSSGNCISGGAVNSSTDDTAILRSDGAITSRRSSSGGTSHMFFLNGGSQVGSITSNTGQTFFNTTSDYRLKENVNYTFDATSSVKLLKPAKFNYIADDTNTLIEGFLAHEVEEVVPQAIHGTKDDTDEDGNIIPQQIDHSALVPLLVKTIQELEARITALENAE